MRAARASLLVPVLAWASTSFAEEPHDGLFPEPDSSRLEDIDDYQDPETLVRVSERLSDAMPGLDIRNMDEKDLLQTRGV